MLYSRYAYAAGLASGARVLELGCGAGLGLGMLGERASRVVGGDVDLELLDRGRRHYGSRVPFVQLTAESLPFAEGSFDLVLFFEGSYYVPDMEKCFDEIVRVLAPRGTCILVSANPERRDFIPSPRSQHYHTASELASALASRGLAVEVEGAFPTGGTTAKDRALSAVRRLLQRWGLVPGTLRGRALLKRLVSGPLVLLPPEIGEEFGSMAERWPIPPSDPAAFKVLYATGRRTPSS